MIDIKLKTFIEVVDCKSFTRAAEHLHLTQPAVTQHIKQFESQLYKVAIPLTIGSTLSIADYYLPEILGQYLTSSSQRCQIYVNNTQTLVQKMIDGEVDCAFVEGQFDPQLFTYHLFKN